MTRIITKQLHILSRNTHTIEHWQSKLRIQCNFYKWEGIVRAKLDCSQLTGFDLY